MAERPVRGEAIEKAVDVGEDLLDNVFGLDLVAEDPSGAAAQPGAVARDQPVEAAVRVGTAGLQAADELGVGILVSGGRDRGHAGEASGSVRRVGFRDGRKGARFFRGRRAQRPPRTSTIMREIIERTASAFWFKTACSIVTMPRSGRDELASTRQRRFLLEALDAVAVESAVDHGLSDRDDIAVAGGRLGRRVGGCRALRSVPPWR